MIGFNSLLAICLLYAILLFLVAFGAEKLAQKKTGLFLNSPLIYTLSLSVYCTAWTFYGAVGYAARSGLEYVAIYLGPTLIMIGWWWILRKLVRVGRAQHATSIADMVSARYGKSNRLAVLVTLIAVIGTTPYISLQLQSVTLSFSVFTQSDSTQILPQSQNAIAFWVATGLAVFTIIFGTRNLNINERHHGVVTAIAVEAIVKLLALISVGVFVVWGVGGGISGISETLIDTAKSLPEDAWSINSGRWIGLTFLSAAAFLTLPRMFQVLVVENSSEDQLRTASWAFPSYMLLMSLFVLPIAIVGLSTLPTGSNPDLFVLTVPLHFDQNLLAAFAFIGGFSSATSMVIVASIALATMVSNHIIMPIWLASDRDQAAISGDVRKILLIARRASIIAVLALGYFYYRMSGGGEALASIGLVSFAGVAQVLPAFLGGLFWRGASRQGAVYGLITGFLIWAYTLFLPSVGSAGIIPSDLLTNGPFGLSWLRPQALFGVDALDPVIHAIFWSITLNSLVFVTVSLLTFPTPIERLQGAQFVNAYDHSKTSREWTKREAAAEDLLIMAQRIMGTNEAQTLFQSAATSQGKTGYLPDTTPDFIARLERALTGSVGAATAHAMIAQIVGGSSVSVDDLIAVADEAQQILEYSAKLEANQTELTKTARQLSDANAKLTKIAHQKDAFLSQISHELRTPMTSIRSFSEIMRDGGVKNPQDTQRHAAIIHGEAERLTGLLDDLLDLSVLESGQVHINHKQESLSSIIERAIRATSSICETNGLKITPDNQLDDIVLNTDTDRLAQVFINLITNAAKYCTAKKPTLHIRHSRDTELLNIDFIDNGTGIPSENTAVIFEKFSRLSDQASAGSAGLGLAICREIMSALGGKISYLPAQRGAAFRLTLPIKN